MKKDLSPKSIFSFWSLIGVMFQGALSDNIYKFVVMMLVLKVSGLKFPTSPDSATAYAGKLTSIADALFILPFALAVTIAGWLGDRFSKTRVTLWTKIWEAIIMAIGIVTLGMGNLTGAFIVLFFMGLQSAVFSPSKYGILPELLPESKLAWANGILQGGTFLAIILGTIIGPWLFDEFENALWIPCIILVALALLGTLISLTMKQTPPANPAEKFSINPIPMIKLYGKEIFSHTGLKWSMFGMIVWWLVGVMLQGSALITAAQILDLTPKQTGYALLPIVFCLGAGCFLTGIISKNRIELGLVPFGAIAMFITTFLTWWLIPDFDQISKMTSAEFAKLKIIVPVMMGLVGLVCGFFIVPLQAYFVQSADPAKRGGVWAVSNVLVSVGMILGAIIKGFILMMTSSPALVFLVSGIIMLITGFVICIRFPEIPLRFLSIFILRGLYRINVEGVENVPKDGGVILSPNHQSYIDAILISSVIERPVRFIIAEDIYKKPLVYPFAKLTKSIPVKSLGSARALIQALREAAQEIRNGGVVCIFPEGQLTRIGMMLPFKRGFEFILKRAEAPIIPIAIDGAYDTAFSQKGGKARWRRAFKFLEKRRSLNVIVGKPMPSKSRYWEVRQSVTDLMVRAYEYRKNDANLLHRYTYKNLRANLFSKKIADHTSNGLVSNLKILSAAIVLGRKIKNKWKNDEIIGIMLPPMIACVSLNLAASLAGKVVVNLNYTASPSIIKQICEFTNIKTIITSKEFLAKINMILPEGIDIIYLEDIKDKISISDKVSAIFTIFFRGVVSVEKMLGRTKQTSVDDVCTIIFSSGSTGIPKGVELTHWNIYANIISAYQMVDFPPDGRLLGILPFFHSFGYTVVMWLPLIVNFSVIYFPNPLYGREIGNIVANYKITHLFTTPTILNTYTRRVQPDQFGSLRMILTGAEKLRLSIADEFAKRFGIMPIEGFGTTECSPIVCLNTPDLRMPGFYQKGTVHGTVGHPLPGVMVKIVDLETGEPLPLNTPGMLLVKGHNIMKGYYKMPEKTKECIKDGWYITGDVAQVDENGFIKITDRLSRFSKIGGEMVPHIKIEEELYKLSGLSDPVFAVTGVADIKKGERLIVLYSLKQEKMSGIIQALQKSELPPLWIPKPSDFIYVESIPVLGTGKLDLQGIKSLAEKLTGHL